MAHSPPPGPRDLSPVTGPELSAPSASASGFVCLNHIPSPPLLQAGGSASASERRTPTPTSPYPPPRCSSRLPSLYA